jgi:hypothetical protein
MATRRPALGRFLILATLGAAAAQGRALACTTAVISGAATADGRPILWKSRDASDLHNQVVWRNDGRYSYLGVVNQGDALGMEIWAGINSTGFAIMNSASYNLDDKETLAEGAIMKLALQSCRTVADFQALLEASNATGRDTTANFGVIDAAGGAAIFETGLKAYVRYDATDPKPAPGGYLIRTNYSESGDAELGSGMLRAERARTLFAEILAAGKLDVATLLGRVVRDVANAATGQFPRAPGYAAPFAYIGDSINRSETASAAVFHGAAAGEDPRLATMWVILGQPISGAAVPLWVGAGAVPVPLAVGEDPAPLNAAFDRVRDLLIPSRRGDLKRYLDARVLRAAEPGLVPALAAVEKANLERAGALLAAWRTAAPEAAAMAAAQEEIAAATLTATEALLARVAAAPPASTR